MGRSIAHVGRTRRGRFGARRPAAAVAAGLAVLSLLGLAMGAPAASAAVSTQVVATGLTAPRGVLTDPAGRLWVSDSVKGFCRLTTPSGSTPGGIEAATCLGGASSTTGPKQPGQAALFQPSSGSTLALVPDSATGSAAVMRAQWNAGTGKFSYLDALTLFGGDMAPTAVSVGPNAHAYVVLGHARSIVRIVDPGAAQPEVQTVGFTAATGTRAVASAAQGAGGTTLYIASATGLVQYAVTTADTDDRAPSASFAVGTPSSLWLDPTGKTLYVGSNNATSVGGDTITSVDTTSGQITSNWATGFTRVGGIAAQGPSVVAVDSGSVAASPASSGSAYLVGAAIPAITAGPTAADGSPGANPALTNNAKPAFTIAFGGTGALQCGFDNANWFACAVGKVTAPTALADGAHTFGVRVGSTGTPVQQTFTVDTTPPAAPLVTAPAGGATVGASTVLQATAEAGSTLRCAIDPAGSALGTACTSGQALTFSTAGTHTLKVTATDPAGNVSPAVTLTVVVNLTAPTVTITKPAADGTTLTGTASFEFGAAPATGVTFACKVDTAGYAPCTSPATPTGLTAGSHTFWVQATSALGNVATASRQFVFANPVPNVVTVSPAAGAYASGQQITLSVSPAGGRIYYTVDGTTPTTSSPKYSAPLTLTQAMTLRYFAVDAQGNNPSAVGSQAYTVTVPPTGNPPQQDFTSDGVNDVLATASNGALWLYPGDGSGGLLARSQVGTGWSGFPTVFTPGDFDGDGHPDVMASDSSGRLWLYPGNGSGGFLARSQVGTGWGIMTTIFGAGDFNGDGAADVMARDSSGRLWLYPGDGEGGWGSPSVIGTGWGGMTTIFGAGDFDGDGHPDVMARDSSGRLWLYPGNGTGGWRAQKTIGTGWGGMNAILSVGDLNGDGLPDVLARDGNGVLWLYPGDGRGGWGTTRQVATGWASLVVLL